MNLFIFTVRINSFHFFIVFSESTRFEKYSLKIFLIHFNIIFDGVHFAPVSPKFVITANKYLSMVHQQIFLLFLLFKFSQIFQIYFPRVAQLVPFSPTILS